MRRLAKILGLAVAGLLLLLVGAWLLRGPLLARPLARLLADQLGAALGGRFSCERVEGTFFTDVSVVGLKTLEPPPGGALTGLALERAEVRFRPLDLLSGDPLGAIASVTVTGALVRIDLTRPTAEEAEEEALDLEAILLEIPARFPAVDVRGEVDLVTPDGPVIVRGLHLRDEEGRAVRLRADRLVLPPVFSPEEENVLDLSIAVEGAERVRVVAHEPLAGLLLEEVDLGTRLAYRARLSAGARTRIEAEGDLAAAHLRLAPLDLADVPAWVRALLPADVPARGLVQADLQAGWEGALRARGSLEVRDAGWRDLEVRSLTLEGRYEDGRGEVSVLEALLDAGRADVRELGFDLELPVLVSSLGSASVDVPDLRRFLPDFDRPLAVRATLTSPDARRVALQDLVVSGEGGVVRLEGSAVLPDDPEDWRAIEVTLDLDATVEDPSRIEATLPRIEGELKVTGGVRGTVGDPQATLTVLGEGLRVEDREVRRVEVEASLDGLVATIGRALVDAAPGSVEAGGVVDLEAGTVADGRFAFDIVDLAGFLAMFPGMPAAEGRIRGHGTGSWDGSRPRGEASLSGEGLRVEGESIDRFELEAMADGERIEVGRLLVVHPEGEAELSASVDLGSRQASVASLRAEARGCRVDLAGPADIEWNDAGDVSARGLDLGLLGGAIRGDASWTGGRPGADVTLLDLDLEQLFAVPGLWPEPLRELRGIVGGRLLATDERLEVDVSSPRLRWQDRSGDLELVVRQEAGSGLRVESLRVQVEDLATLTAEAHLPWRVDPEQGLVAVGSAPAEPEFHVSAAVPDLSRILDVASGSLLVEFDAKGKNIDGLVAVDDLVAQEQLALPGRTTIRVAGDAAGIRAELQTQTGGAGVLSGEIVSDRGLDWTRPEALEETLERARVDGELSLLIPDLSVFLAVLDDLPYVAGRATIRADVSGPLLAPVAEGSLVLADLEIAPGGDLPPIREGVGTITFDGRTVRVEELAGELGYERFALTGTVGLDGTEPAFDLRLSGSNLLLARSRDLRARADLDLAVTGPMSALLVSGKVVVTDALFSQPMSITGGGGARTADAKLQLFSFRDPPLSTMRFDIEIRGSESVRVVNNAVRGAFSPALRLRGTGAVPEPIGSVFFRETLVKLPFSSLKVDQGEVRFAQENPFAPRIEVRAHTRMRGYDLSVRTTGEVPEVEVMVSAVPSLSQEDAIVLLTTGSLPADFEGDSGGRTALTKVGTLVGRSLIDRLAGPSDPDTETVFDRLEIEIGRDISREGNETVEAEFRMLPRWFLRLELDRYDEYNGGVVWRIRFR